MSIIAGEKKIRDYCLSDNLFFFFFQYTDWERSRDGYMYQEMISDAVGDYYFICPSIQFAQLFADRGMKVYYYYFTHVSGKHLKELLSHKEQRQYPFPAKYAEEKEIGKNFFCIFILFVSFLRNSSSSFILEKFISYYTSFFYFSSPRHSNAFYVPVASQDFYAKR